MTKHRSTTSQQGFTLIELSIVLVIIGLIVGGILTGQSMIQAAQVRAQITQIDKYNTAVNTFRSKYNGLPGDLANPVNFFPALTAAVCTGATGQANGNGLIESSGTDIQGIAGESTVFWYELFQANLIADNMTNATCSAAAALTLNVSTPAAKLGGGNYVSVANQTGLNYWAVFGNGAATTTAAATSDLASAMSGNLSPNQAFQLDSKVDDGDAPTTGIVQAGGAVLAYTAVMSTIWSANGSGAATGALAAGDCTDTTLNIYATDSALSKDANGCILRWQHQLLISPHYWRKGHLLSGLFFVRHMTMRGLTADIRERA